MALKVKRAGPEDYGTWVKMLIAGEPGSGKGFPSGTRVLKPSGWTSVESLVVGDEVIGATGEPVSVAGCFKRGLQPCYEVSFDDGAKIICDADHLWSVQTRKTRYTSRTWFTVSTALLADDPCLAVERSGRRPALKYFVPLVEPVQHDKVDLPIPPYTLGTLLANGHLRLDSKPILSTNDLWVFQRVRSEGVGLTEHAPTQVCKRWAVDVRDALRELGLEGKKSFEKFVPEGYLTAHEEARRSLLAGLCDCDGSSGKGNRRHRFYTSSPFLKDAVVALVRSLGGMTRVSAIQRELQWDYSVSIMGLDPFSNHKSAQPTPAWRAIESVVPVEPRETFCLKVDAADELFVVQDYIVTHNTRTASTWPGVFYANAEGGQLAVADRRPPAVDIESTSVLTELHQVFTQAPQVREKILGTSVETVVVDTFDEIARLFIRERLQAEHKEAMAIQDWGWLGDRLRDFVRGWRNLQMNVLLLVHTKSVEDSETGRVTYKPAVQGAMGDEIAGYVDMAVLLRARPTNRVVKGENVRVIERYLQTYPDIQHPWLKDRSGRLPLEFPINLNDDYARIHQAIFGGAGAPAEQTQAVMAPPAPPPAQTQPSGPRKPPPPPVQAPPVGPDGPEPEAVGPPETVALVDPPVDTPDPLPPVPVEIVPDPVPVAIAPPMPTVEAPLDPLPETEPAAQPPLEQAAPVAPAPAVSPPPAPDPTPTMAQASGNGSMAPELPGGLEDWQICESCGNEIETKDHGDLSFIRFKQRLCRSCFAEKKKAKV